MISTIFLIILFIIYFAYIIYLTNTDINESFSVSLNRPLTVSISDKDECSPIHPLSKCKYVSFKNPCILHENTSIPEPSLKVSGTFNVCKDNYCKVGDIGTNAFLPFSDLLANQSGEGVRQLAVENILSSPPTHIKDKMNDLNIKTRTFIKKKQKIEKQIEDTKRDTITEANNMWSTYCENTPFPTIANKNDLRYRICSNLQKIFT